MLVQDGSLQSFCPLNGCCKEGSDSYCTKYQPVGGSPKMSHQLVGVWSECPAFCENKTPEISSEESGCFSMKTCTSKNFPLCGTFTWKIFLQISHFSGNSQNCYLHKFDLNPESVLNIILLLVYSLLAMSSLCYYRSVPQIRPPFCNLSLSTKRRGAYTRDATFSLAITPPPPPPLDREMSSGSVDADFVLALHSTTET